MKNKNNFLDICKKDIKEIYGIITPYLPDFEIEHFKQSVIYEQNKKILCRSIKNDNKTVIGHEIAIYIYDTGEIVRLIKKENSLKLEKHYCLDNDSIKEMVKISYKNDFVKRYFAYCNGNNKTQSDEKYNFNSSISINDYINSDSIETTFKKLKSKNKVKKRT